MGGDPAPGDPAALDEVVRSFAQTAANAREAHSRLTRLAAASDESVWRGEAADAFRDEIAELPPVLAKLYESYQAAAEGMAAYGRVLRELQAKAKMLLAQAQAAQHEQAAAQQARDQALTQDPLTPTVGYEQAIGDAQSRLASLRSQLEEVRERHRAAENAAMHVADEFSTPIWTSTSKKSGAENALRHFRDHGPDFPEVKNGLDHVRLAQQFLTRPRRGPLQRFALTVMSFAITRLRIRSGLWIRAAHLARSFGPTLRCTGIRPTWITSMLSDVDYRCRVCGWLLLEPPWGVDGRSPKFDYCPSCGVEFGYQDATPTGARRYREQWLREGGRFSEPDQESDEWDLKAQLEHIPPEFR